MSDEAPRPVSNVILELEITGYAIPYWNGQPVLLRMPGTPSDHRFIAVFSTREKLEQLWRDYATDLEPYDDVKQVANGPEFIASIVENELPWLRIIVDPYRHPSGKCRFTEVILPGN